MAPKNETSQAPTVTEDKPSAIRGAGEVFIFSLGVGKLGRHAQHLSQAEEIITPKGMRTTVRGVIIVFEGGQYICKAEQHMTADQVSVAIRALPEYGRDIYSLSDDKTMRTGPVASGLGLKCPHCDKTDFPYLEEYNAHVSVCQRVKSDSHLKRHYDILRKRAGEVTYVPNDSPRNLK